MTDTATDPKHYAELAKILGVLRESGLDDATLLEVVSRMGTSPDVVDAIELRGVLEGTAARLAAERGAAIIRAHDVAATVDALAMWAALAEVGEV